MIVKILGWFGGGITSLIGLYASALQINDHQMSRRVLKAKFESLPIRIRKGISYSQLLSSVKITQEVLDELRFYPDLIIGIHYNGLSFATLIAKQLYCPIHHASIHYGTETGRHIPDTALLSIELDELQGKRVLLVDNGMQTGTTLEFIRSILESNNAMVKTLIFYQKGTDLNVPRKPDIVLFHSKKPLECFVR